MATAEGGASAKSRRGRGRAAPPREAPLVQPLRGRIPALDTVTGEALRDFFAVSRWWLLGDGATVQAVPGTAPPAGFALDAEGTHLALHVEGPAGSGNDDPTLRWSDHAGRSRVLAWSLAHERTLRRLSEWLGTSLLPTLDGADAGGASDAPGGTGAGGTDRGSCWLSVHIEDAPAEGGGEDGNASPTAATHAWLRLPTSWLQGLAARAEPQHEDDPLPGAGRWRDWPVRVALLMPMPLAMRDWRALRPGDVIVAGHRSQPPPCVARAAGRDWPLAPAAGGWAVNGDPITATAYNEEPSMTEQEQEGGSPSDAAPAAAPDPARSLPVQVEFELGRTEMSVGELADLQPGYVFPLAAALEGSNVVIRANGRVAGRGELVAVGDTLGVRLLSWS